MNKEQTFSYKEGCEYCKEQTDILVTFWRLVLQDGETYTKEELDNILDYCKKNGIY